MPNSEQFKIVVEHISDVLIEQIKSFNLIKADRGVDYVVLKPREDDEYNRYGNVIIFDLTQTVTDKYTWSWEEIERNMQNQFGGILVEYRYYAYKGFDLSIIGILKKFGASQINEYAEGDAEPVSGDEEDYGESLSRIFELKEEDVDRILKELIDKNDTDAIISIF
jgi:hypothetical protein